MWAAGFWGSSPGDLLLIKFSYPIPLSPPPSSPLSVSFCQFLFWLGNFLFSFPIQVLKAEMWLANLMYSRGPCVSRLMGSILVYGKRFLVKCLAPGPLSMVWGYRIISFINNLWTSAETCECQFSLERGMDGWLCKIGLGQKGKK